MDPKFVNSDQNSIDVILEFYILTDNKFGILWTNTLKCSLIIPYLNTVFKLWAVCSQHFVCNVFCEASWGSIFIQTIWNYLNILLHFAAVYKINGLSVFLLLIGKSLARFSISLGIMF